MGEQNNYKPSRHTERGGLEVLIRYEGRNEPMKVQKGLLRLQNVAGIRTAGWE